MNRYIAKPSRGGPIDNEARERKLRGLIAKLEERVEKAERRLDEIEARREANIAPFLIANIRPGRKKAAAV